MRTFVAALVLIRSSSMVLGQCGSTWQVASDFPCVSPGGTIVHRVSGGSPPFQITLYAGTSSTVLASSSGITTDYNPGFVIYQPFRAVVTDVNSCVQTVYCSGYTTIPQVDPPIPTIMAVDPETGVGGFGNVLGAVSVSGCQPYRIKQGATIIRTGTLATDWTNGNSSSGSYTGLPPGNYTVEYNNQGCPGASLSNWAQFSYLGSVSQPWSCVERVPFCNAQHGVSIPVPGTDPDPVRLSMKILLEGPYDQSAGLMNDALRANDKLPWRPPYSFLNNQQLATNMLESNMSSFIRSITGSDAPVDWVLVELRDPNNQATIVYARTALVQRDGDVVMQNGQGPLSCNIAAGSYYVVVKHRNHLGIMTAAPVPLNLNTATIDFTIPGTATYGTNARKQVGTRMVMWAGDAKGNGTVQYTGTNNDRDPILTAVGGTTPNSTIGPVYDLRDTNMDGVIKYTGAGNDRDPILINVGSTTPNSTRTQQLP